MFLRLPIHTEPLKKELEELLVARAGLREASSVRPRICVAPTLVLILLRVSILGT